MPAVSVFILSYNQQSFLQQRIESVLAQTYPDFDVIIWDDASTDNSSKIIEQYNSHPLVKEIIYNTQNSGNPFIQWQAALNKAAGKYLWIAEGDDFATPEFLSACVPVLEADSALCLVESNAHYIFDDRVGLFTTTAAMKNHSFPAMVWNNNFTCNGGHFFSKYLCYGNCIPNVSAVLFRAEALKNINFDFNKYRYCGDWALYIELSKQYSFAYLHQVLAGYRLHNKSVFGAKQFNGVKQRELFSIVQNNAQHLKRLKVYKHGYTKAMQRYISLFDVPLKIKIRLLAYYIQKDYRLAMSGLLHNIAARLKNK